MSAETYSIFIKVDSTQAKTAAQDLTKMGEASVKAEVSLKKMSSTNTAAADSSKTLSNALNNTTGNTQKAVTAFDSMTKAANSVRSAFVLLIGMEVARFMREAAGSVREAADAYTDMTSRLNIATVSQIEMAKGMREVSAIAEKYYTNITDVATAYAKFNPILATLGRSQSDTEKVVSSLSASLLVSGANVTDASESFRQFAQAISGPVVQMEEMSTIIDSNQALWRGLNRELSPLVVKYGSLKNAISANAVTNEMLVNATIKLGKEFDDLAARKVPTIGNALTVLNNKFIEYVGQTDKSSGITKSFSTTIVEFANNLDKVLNPISKIIPAFVDLADSIAKLAVQLGPLAEGFLNFLGVIAQIEGSALKKITNLVDAIEALAGSTEKFKQVTDINMAVVNDKTLAGIEAEISLNKERLRQYKELGATNEQSSAQIKFLEDRLVALDKTKEAYFAQADAAKKAEQQEMARIDAQRQAGVTPTGVDDKAAKKARDEAEKNFRELIDFQISQAENAARIFKAQSDTKLAQIESEKKAIQSAAEIDISEAKTKEERLAIYLKLQKDLQDQITKESEIKQGLLQSDVDVEQARIDALTTLINKSGEYQMSQADVLRIEQEIAKAQTDIAIAPETSKQNEIDALNKLRDSAAAYNKERASTKDVEKDVRDEALRTLAVMQSNLDFAREMATGFADAFGTMGDAIGGVVVSLAEYEKQMATIDIQMKEDIAKNPAKRYEIEQDAALKSSKTQIKAYGDMASSAQKFFTKGSKGYEAMGAAVKVFRAFEMAQSAMSTAKFLNDITKNVLAFVTGEEVKAAASVATTPVVVEAETTKQVEYSKTAIAAQGEIPIAGFALMAAMAALLAVYGIAGGGSKGSSSTPVKAPGTGTVLGDPTAQSESLKNSLQSLVDLNTNDLAYSADMVKSLQSIDSSLKNASALIARQITPLIQELTSKFSATSSMMSSSQLEKAGFLFNDQKLSKVLQTGLLTGRIGYRATTSTGLMGEFHSVDQATTAYGKKLQEAFGDIVSNIYDTIVKAGEKIGTSVIDIQNNLKDFVISLGEVNLAGMSAEESAAAINAAFSAMSDQMAMQALPQFKDFQQTGEGYFQTISRVASGVADARGKLEQLGFTAINFTDVIQKQGDIEAEIARQTLIGQAKLGSGVKDYVNELSGTIDDILNAYKQLVDVQNVFVGLGQPIDNITRTMINAAGGLSAFQDAINTFVDAFMTPEDKVRIQGKALADTFDKLAVQMPSTRKGFTDLILGLDTSTEAGQKLYGQLIALSPAFDTYITGIEDLHAAFTDLFSSIKDFQSSIKSDIAGLLGTIAQFDLAVTNAQEAYAALFNQIGLAEQNITGSQTEIDLLGKVESAVMARYNAELALINKAAQAQAAAIKQAASDQIASVKASADAQINALNDAKDAQIKTINNATDAQVQAINDALDAEILAKEAANKIALDSLKAEYDAAVKLKNAVEQVKQYAQGLALGGASPLSPEAKFLEAQKQYTTLLQKARGGDADAIAQLSSAADTYLQASKDYYGSSTQYANIFDGVKKAMESIGAMNVADPESIQSRIDALSASQQAELDALKKTAENQITAIKDGAAAQIEALKLSISDQIDAIKAQTDFQVKTIQDVADAQVSVLTDPEQNQAILDLKNRTIDELQNLARISQEVEDAANARQKASDQIALDSLTSQQHTESYLAKLVGESSTTSSNSSVSSSGTTTGSSEGINATMQSVATETKASVAIQQEAFPQLISRLSAIDTRLSNIERIARLTTT